MMAFTSAEENGREEKGEWNGMKKKRKERREGRKRG
jgi:hypothetical protein